MAMSSAVVLAVDQSETLLQRSRLMFQVFWPNFKKKNNRNKIVIIAVSFIVVF